MHVILVVLGTVVTILVLLNRLAEAGIDLRGLNLFLWGRKRRWKKFVNGNPLHQINSPLEVTALLIAAVATMGGNMSSREKKAVLSTLRTEFELSKREAAELLVSSVHLLGNGKEVHANLPKVLGPSLVGFSESQSVSALEILYHIREIGSDLGDFKQGFIEQIEQVFSQYFQPQSSLGMRQVA